MGVVDYGMNLQEAVNASRFHHQWLPDEVYVERGTAPDPVTTLQQMGHRVLTEDYWSDAECIAIDSKTGERLGASDVRNNGKAVGY
jgi:gamma-glutamyltranspeptidase/glutathione hydrolase